MINANVLFAKVVRCKWQKKKRATIPQLCSGSSSASLDTMVRAELSLADVSGDAYQQAKRVHASVWKFEQSAIEDCVECEFTIIKVCMYHSSHKYSILFGCCRYFHVPLQSCMR
jgi:hypothetical protein